MPLEHRRAPIEDVDEPPGVEEVLGLAEILVLVEAQRDVHPAEVAIRVFAADLAEVAQRPPGQVAARGPGEAAGLIGPAARLGQIAGRDQHEVRLHLPGRVVVARPLEDRPGQQAIEGHHEVGDELVVLSVFGRLVELLHQGAVVGPVAAVVDVAQQHRAREGPRISDPALAEALELLLGVLGEELGEEALLARFKRLVEQEPRHGAGCCLRSGERSIYPCTSRPKARISLSSSALRGP
jgi:hypothetical protein